MSGRAEERVRNIPVLRFRVGDMSPAESAENAEGEANGNTVSARTLTAPWVRKKFSDFAALRRGLTYTPSDCRDNGVRVLRSSNILEDVFLMADDDVFVSQEAARILPVRNGDILITAANGSSNLVGKHAIINGVDDGAAVHGGFMLLASTEEPAFLHASMSSFWYRDFVASNMLGGNGALGNLGRSAFDDAVFFAPDDNKERAKLGSLFGSLDALIDGRAKALGKLESLKKAMLQKMFPQGDSKTPELRFKGFEGEWKLYRFDEVFQHVPSKAYQIQAEEYLGAGRYPVVDQGQLPIVGYSNNATKVCKARENPVVVFGDHTRIVKYVDFDFVVGADGTQLLRASDHDLMFLTEVIYGLPLPNMGYSRHYKYLQESIFLLPDLFEQKKIGAYFRSLDALLAARREEVAKLRDLKKALLERMFV